MSKKKNIGMQLLKVSLSPQESKALKEYNKTYIHKLPNHLRGTQDKGWYRREY